MTRDDLRSVIQAAGHGTDAQSVAAQNTALKQAFYEVWTRRAWLFRRATAAPTNTIGDETLNGLPSDLSYPIALRASLNGIGQGEITPIRPEVIEDYLLHDIGTGPPSYWTWNGTDLVIYPKPDQVYTWSLVYAKDTSETAFDDDTDPIPWDEDFHPVLAWIALRILAFRQRDQVSFNAAKNEAEQMLAQMERRDSRAAQDQTSVVHWPGWDLVKAG